MITTNYITVFVLSMAVVTGGSRRAETVTPGDLRLELPVSLEFDPIIHPLHRRDSAHIDLLEYPMFRDHRQHLRCATAYRAAFWIDHVSADDSAAMPELEQVEFSIRFSDDEHAHLLARFEGVGVEDYLRRPHVVTIPGTTQRAIELALRTHDSFDVVQRYSACRSNGTLLGAVDSRIDIALRREIVAG